MKKATKESKGKEEKPKKEKKTVEKVPEKEIKKEKKQKEEKEIYDPWKILLHAHLAEKSIGMVETQNTLSFIVTRKANKKDIREAIEKGFNVEVKKVTVERTRKGVKKAYITLSPKHSAADIATRLGMI